MMVRCWS